jgi:hypothetical protein
MGRRDAAWLDRPDASRAGEYRADYLRGWRQVKAEDALDADTEWDDECAA